MEITNTPDRLNGAPPPPEKLPFLQALLWRALGGDNMMRDKKSPVRRFILRRAMQAGEAESAAPLRRANPSLPSPGGRWEHW